MVCGWFAVGSLLVCCWFAVGLLSVGCWFPVGSAGSLLVSGWFGFLFGRVGVRGEKGRTSDNVSVQLVCSWFAVGLEIAASGSWFAVGLQLVSKLGGSLSWFPVGFPVGFCRPN